MARILVVEDEPTVSDVVARYLRREGYQVDAASDGVEGLRLALERQPDLVVLDVMLPGLDGLEVCRQLRATRQTPVIMLTARAEDGDAVVGLALGADDYVRKPFSPPELVARVKAVLRRGRPAGGATAAVFGEISIDAGGRVARRGDETLDLTATEFDLLWHMSSHSGQVFSREQLLSTVWGYDYAGDTGTVTVHMRRLREKLERDPSAPRWLKTVWGVGYKFETR
jgi:DNA-binding response OmpR family regulator